MGGDYHIRKITTRPAELGFHSVNRERNYFLLAHKKLARFIGEPAQIYRQMADRLVNFDVTISSLFWESDPLELRKEILDSLTAGRVGSLEDISTIDWTQYLTPWERENLDVYTQMYLEKHGSLTDAVFSLSQNPRNSRGSWTCHSGAGPPSLPTLSFGLFLWRLFFFVFGFLHKAHEQ